MTDGLGRGAFAPGRFRLLLLALVVLIVGTAAATGSRAEKLVELALLSIAVCVALAELRAPGQRHLVPFAVAISVILLAVLDYTRPIWHLPLIASALVTVFSGIVIWLTYGSVMRSHRSVGDRIVGAICVYVLIGLGWAAIYETLDGVVPGSFRFPADTSWATPGEFRYRYFSFITLATVGYGDITPVTALAGTLAALEAIAGQLYIGITVARLVALSMVDRTGS